MRMTSRKKEILSYFEPDNLEWVTGETNATVVRYGLPGQCAVVRDNGGADNSISGEYERVG